MAKDHHQKEGNMHPVEHSAHSWSALCTLCKESWMKLGWRFEDLVLCAGVPRPRWVFATIIPYKQEHYISLSELFPYYSANSFCSSHHES
eukprot:2553942-Amphidinium_carterae.1